MTRRRRGGVKRGETNLASNQFPMYSSQSGTPREVHRFKWRREQGGGKIDWLKKIKQKVKKNKELKEMKTSSEISRIMLNASTFES